jgi:uncharacterized RDD family membrane protein YckC
MTETPPPPPDKPEGGGTPPQDPYGSQPSAPPPAPQNPYSSAPPPPPDPYAGNPPTAGQTPYGATPYPTTPGGPAPVAGVLPAGLLERFLARFIDGIIVGIVQVVIAVATTNVIGGVIGGILYLGYYAYMESSQGRTFGKQIMKLRVLGPTGGNPTMEESLRRNAWAALSIVSSVPVLGLFTGLAELVAVIAIAVTISQDAVTRRGWHDKFANTSVIKGA